VPECVALQFLISLLLGSPVTIWTFVFDFDHWKSPECRELPGLKRRFRGVSDFLCKLHCSI
jgi:hypothetical protein